MSAPNTERYRTDPVYRAGVLVKRRAHYQQNKEAKKAYLTDCCGAIAHNVWKVLS